MSKSRLISLYLASAISIAYANDGRAWGDETTQDFRLPLQTTHFRLKGATAREYVKSTPDGLLIAIPGGRTAKLSPEGVIAKFHVTGDFDATAEFELLNVDKPTEGYGTGVVLWALPDGPTGKVSVGRSEQVTRGGTITAYHAPLGTEINKGKKLYFPTQMKKGRLRLSRKGDKIHYFAAEGDGDFVEYGSVEFGNSGIREIGVFADTGGSMGGLELLLKNLRVEGKGLGSGSRIEGQGLDSNRPIEGQGLTVGHQVEGQGFYSSNRDRTLLWIVIGSLSGIAIATIAFYVWRKRSSRGLPQDPI